MGGALQQTRRPCRGHPQLAAPHGAGNNGTRGGLWRSKSGLPQSAIVSALQEKSDVKSVAQAMAPLKKLASFQSEVRCTQNTRLALARVGGNAPLSAHALQTPRN